MPSLIVAKASAIARATTPAMKPAFSQFQRARSPARCIATGAALAFALAACGGSDARRPAPPKLIDTGKPALHAIDSQDLRQSMQRMHNLMYERNLTEHEMDNQRREALYRVQQAAEGVEQALTDMRQALPRLHLEPDEQKVFASLADKLLIQAGQLKSQAQTLQLDAIPATLEAISATCTSCHELFRDFRKPGDQ